MSHIIRALQVAKGEKPQPTPADGTDPAPGALPAPRTTNSLQLGARLADTKSELAPFAPARPSDEARSASRVLWIAAVALLLVASGAGWWWSNRPRTPPAPPAAKAAPKPQAIVTPTAPEVASPQPSPELAERVRKLPVSAAVRGGQRVLIGGKVFVPGDSVAEGLVLHEVFPDLLVFRDAAGNYYQRRL